MAEKLTTKQSFFEALDQLDEPDEDGNCSFETKGLVLSSQDEASGRFNHKKAAPSSGHLRVSPSREDSLTGHPCNIEKSRAVSPRVPDPISVSRPQETRIMSTTKSGGPPRKKRRPKNAKIIPEDQQIFKDLVFCKLFHMGFTPLSLTHDSSLLP